MRSLAAALSTLLILPGVAAARHPVVPPDNSGADQYVEIIPTANGGRPSDNLHPHGAPTTNKSTGSTVLAPSTRRQLVSQGRDGVQAATLAAETAPASVHTATVHRSTKGKSHSTSKTGATPVTKGPSGGPPASAPAAVSSASPASEVFHALTGSASHGGLGALLPTLLIAIMVAALAFAVGRRRRRAT